MLRSAPKIPVFTRASPIGRILKIFRCFQNFHISFFCFSLVLFKFFKKFSPQFLSFIFVIFYNEKICRRNFRIFSTNKILLGVL